MPAFSLGIGMVPYVMRMMRASVIETLQEPFMSYARAKGLKEKVVFVRYLLRHSICQVVLS
jgi:ABC-type dipeptide/oligopeptide/nickel transport system permease component